MLLVAAVAARASPSARTDERTELFDKMGATMAARADEVTQLPGWEGPLPSKQYSGYLAVGDGTRHLHYYVTESEADPSSDPVTLWLNGGPGG